MPSRRLFLLALLMCILTEAPLWGRPAHKQALAEYFGPFLGKKLHDCRTCHLPDGPGIGESEKPHNAFGARLKSVRDELRRAGKKTSLADRLDAVLQEDSDGDGAANLVEILTGHYPGDAADRPSPAEIAGVDKTLVAFRKHRASYPWRPFETVHRPAIPKVKNLGWIRNPIDSFIAAEHEERGLRPRPEAPRSVLLRRLYIDLIGLPPTLDELHAFLEDTSPDAYEKVVDRLLASPRYGERWGRHWMDVWRYSDWAGYGPQVRDSQPYIWRWRDWIVAAVNQDKSYDRMILEMLAGDELAPQDPQALVATGYLVRNFKLLSREKWLQDTVEHTAQAFLGITLGCARCHDHMFDPLLQKEYYQVRAIFEPHQVRTDPIPGQPDIKKDGFVRVFDKDLAAATYLFVRGDDRTPDKSKPLPPGIPEVLGGEFKVEAVKLPPAPPQPNGKPSPYPATSTGRRLAFARWVASRDNPLTARVAMNHIWLRHFGQAIVPSMFDFGRNGRPPSHPALLDWLAAEFMDRDWSMRAMHRLIVTSSTYRMGSTPDPANVASDRDNKYLWRIVPRPAEAEVVRDSIFYVAGKLDSAMGGPDIDFPLGLTVPRRTIYFRHAAEKQMQFVKIFDGPSVSECYERKHSVVPQQALALANSELTIKQARLLARNMAGTAVDDARFIQTAFERILSRPPTPVEMSECRGFLEEQARRFPKPAKAPAPPDADGRLPAPDPKLRARENLIHVLLNHHEFVTIR